MSRIRNETSNSNAYQFYRRILWTHLDQGEAIGGNVSKGLWQHHELIELELHLRSIYLSLNCYQYTDINIPRIFLSEEKFAGADVQAYCTNRQCITKHF